MIISCINIFKDICSPLTDATTVPVDAFTVTVDAAVLKDSDMIGFPVTLDKSKLMSYH
jgi:hypothetical protein